MFIQSLTIGKDHWQLISWKGYFFKKAVEIKYTGK
jgi:hypothetical protein